MNKVYTEPLRALVTGGGKRIGAELVRRCAGMGFAVHIHVNRSRAEAEALQKSLPQAGIHHITTCDLADPCKRAAWLNTLPCFDLVINNASVYRLTPPGEKESASIRRNYFQVNTIAPLEIIQSQLDHPERSGKKLLAVNLLDCDILTPQGGIKEFVMPPEGCDSYLASRIKLAHHLRSMALQYAPQLRVNSIAPGPVLPPVNCKTAGMTVILERVPMKKPVMVSEIADALEFFRRNPSLTGVILPVDGGMHLAGTAQN